MKTSTLIAKMLKENTGASLLDSGGAYGRNFEKNQGRNFDKEPVLTVDINEWTKDGATQHEYIIHYNIYHFLKNFLDYDEIAQALDKKFKTFSNKPENKNEGYLYIMEEWTASIHQKNQLPSPHTFNSYNSENLLSQVIQGVVFEYGQKQYVLLQIHGGCDVRGGYTAPHVFAMDGEGYFDMAMVDLHAKCLKCDNAWYSDDCGYHMYHDNNEPDFNESTHVKDGKLYCSCEGEIAFSVDECY